MTDQKQRETEVALRRDRIDNCKKNYEHFSDTNLEQVVRFNTMKASAISADLADGTAAKAWRRSGDLGETLAQIASKHDDLLLVAEAAKELLSERKESAATREP